MSGILQDDLKQEVLRRIATAVDDVETKLALLTPEQLNWKPSEGRWSVAECLGHLVVTHDAYWPRLQEVTGSTAARATAANRVVSTWLGKMLFKTVDPATTRKAKSPGVFKPSRSHVPGTPVEAFQRCHAALDNFVEATADVDWHGVRVTSPVSRLLKFRLGDVYRVLSAHAERHVNQAIRVTQSEGFPPSRSSAK